LSITKTGNPSRRHRKLGGGRPPAILPALNYNRKSIETPTEVGSRAIFTCPRPEPDIHQGATGSWVGADHAPFLPVLGRNQITVEAPPEVGWGRPHAIFTCPRPEPDIHRGATGSWVGDGHVPFLPVLGRNRISIEAPPEVGRGTATCYALEGEEAAR
jgi:hypothetical protein